MSNEVVSRYNNKWGSYEDIESYNMYVILMYLGGAVVILGFFILIIGVIGRERKQPIRHEYQKIVQPKPRGHKGVEVTNNSEDNPPTGST